MNILLTSAGRRTYMIEYFKNALSGSGEVHASNSVLTYSLKQADRYVLTPQIYSEGYIEFLKKYCIENKISAIIPLFDIDLPILAKSKEVFKGIGVTVVVSDYYVTDICNDKWQTYRFLESIGISQPASYIKIEDAKNALHNGDIAYPLYLKPRWGMGSLSIYKVDNDEELDVLYRRIHRQIFNSYLKFESSVDSDSCIIIQQAIRGQEYGIEILNDMHGEYVATFAKVKIAMRAGETDIAETVDSTPFELIARKISKHLGHICNLDVDCFVDENNDIYILEMNCRFGGQYPFTHNAGVNIPLQIIEWLKGHPTCMNLLSQINGVKGSKDLVTYIF